jgi:DNA-binding HxlR family transcriptional regulator
MLVLRDLGFGRTRFTELLESLEGISPNLLSARLKTLEEHGIIERSFYSDHPPRAEYHLTDKGETLRPVIRALFAWGQEHAPPAPRMR